MHKRHLIHLPGDSTRTPPKPVGVGYLGAQGQVTVHNVHRFATFFWGLWEGWGEVWGDSPGLSLMTHLCILGWYETNVLSGVFRSQAGAQPKSGCVSKNRPSKVNLVFHRSMESSCQVRAGKGFGFKKGCHFCPIFLGSVVSHPLDQRPGFPNSHKWYFLVVVLTPMISFLYVNLPKPTC